MKTIVAAATAAALMLAMSSGAEGAWTPTKKQEEIIDKYYAPANTTEALNEAINSGWVMTAAIYAFYIQAGYTMLEVGAVRVKNTKNILVRDITNICLSVLAFWAVGYAFAFGIPFDAVDNKDWTPNPFIGHNRFFIQGLNQVDNLPYFFFYWTFLATIPATVGGALSERTHFTVYFVHTLATSMWIWPVLAHWIWGGGWLQSFLSVGFLDYAGGFVHVCAGTCALVGCALVGPRLGRYIDGKPRDINGYSTTLMALGVFIQWFGWFGFVAGISTAADGLSNVGAKAEANLVVATSFAGCAAVFWSLVWKRDVDLIWCLHTMNCSFVAISPAAGYVEPWVACIIGCGCILVYRGMSWLLVLIRIDDPMDSIPVHLGGGIWGILVTGVFANRDSLRNALQDQTIDDYGAFLGGGGETTGAAFLGLAVIIGWSAVWSFLVFLPFRLLKILRVDPEIEKKGIDVSGYGADSWGSVEIVDNGKTDEFQFRIQ